MLNKEELATVLAALRMWQRHGLAACQEARAEGDRLGHWLDDIATNGGEHAPLSTIELDALCERLNTQPKVSAPTCCADCGGVVGWDAWVDSNGDLCGGPYDDNQCMGCGVDEPDVAGNDDEGALAK